MAPSTHFQTEAQAQFRLYVPAPAADIAPAAVAPPAPPVLVTRSVRTSSPAVSAAPKIAKIARSPQRRRNRARDTSRWLPDTAFATVFNKQIPHAFGRGATKIGNASDGLFYGQYLQGHNVIPKITEANNKIAAVRRKEAARVAAEKAAKAAKREADLDVLRGTTDAALCALLREPAPRVVPALHGTCAVPFAVPDTTARDPHAYNNARAPAEWARDIPAAGKPRARGGGAAALLGASGAVAATMDDAWAGGRPRGLHSTALADSSYTVDRS